MKTSNVILAKGNQKVGCSIKGIINIGKNNFELLNFIRSNKNLSRKELVDAIIAHPSFISPERLARVNAWRLVQLAKKSKVESPYEIRDTNGGKKNGIWICYFDFSMVYGR